MTIKSIAGAKKALKQNAESISIFETALGMLEVEGWFGKGQPVKGTSTCLVGEGYGAEEVCVDGGPVCAGIAIHKAAWERAHLQRWNKEKTFKSIDRHLDLFRDLAEIDGNPNGLLRGIATWNDHDASYAEVKEAFGTVLQKLTTERFNIVRQWQGSGSLSRHQYSF